jgi:hypothetical protein
MNALGMVQSSACEVAARAQLVAAEGLVRSLTPIDIPVQHHFAQGVYARGGWIKKGSAFVGRVHLQSQINIISQGEVTVLTEQGVVHLVGPCTWASPPGAQRAAIVHEDTYWTTILGTNETDPQVIFDTCTAATFEDFELARDELLQIIKG